MAVIHLRLCVLDRDGNGCVPIGSASVTGNIAMGFGAGAIAQPAAKGAGGTGMMRQVRGGGWGTVNQDTWAPGESRVSRMYDPKTGQYTETVSNEPGRRVAQSPFTKTFGDSVNTMSGLGGMLGNAFGQVNAMNLMSAEKERDRNYMGSLLRQMLGGMNMGGQGGGYGDTMSRQRSGGGGGQMSSMIRGGFYGQGY